MNSAQFNFQSYSRPLVAWSLCLLFLLPHSSIGQNRQDTSSEIGVEIEYQRLEIRPCVERRDYVVTNETELAAVIELDRSGTPEHCGKLANKLPKIDFSQHTLIGASVPTDMCQKFQVKVYRDDEKRIYRHVAVTGRPMMCRGYGKIPIWGLVPTLPLGYEIKFETKVAPQKSSNRIPGE